MNNQLGGNILVVDLKKKFNNNCTVCDNFSNILNLNEKKMLFCVNIFQVMIVARRKTACPKQDADDI